MCIAAPSQQSRLPRPTKTSRAEVDVRAGIADITISLYALVWSADIARRNMHHFRTLTLIHTLLERNPCVVQVSLEFKALTEDRVDIIVLWVLKQSFDAEAD